MAKFNDRQSYLVRGARYASTGTDIGFLLAKATQRAKQVQDMAT